MTEEELLQVIEQAAAEEWTELDLSGNKLTVLPPEIGKLTQLKKLILGKYKYDKDRNEVGVIGNNLTDLPKEIRLLSQLEEIQLIYNKMSIFPREIIQLNNLQFLDLTANKLSILPAEIGQLISLQYLKVGGNILSSLPIEIGQVINLKSLDLRGNRISILPIEIGQLTNLQYLNIQYNQLSNLPTELAQLTNLQSLYLRYNQLSNVPAEIGQLTKLKSLQLSGNQLKNLPTELAQLTNLQSLHLGSNQLSNLPTELAQLTNLQTLHLSSNQLSNVPAEIGQLTNLQSLHLNGNQLSNLPEEIVQLTNLQSLHLGWNQLSNLPGEIVQLTNLQSLDLSNNQLSNLPGEIVQLTNLQSLDLSYNQLSELLGTIKQLTKLKKLDLRGNPVPIPPEILSSKEISLLPGDVNEILDFYFQIQDPSETEPLYEAKLLIVGEGGAGKTSLAKKIEDENYQLQPNEKSTEGINVIKWKFPLLNGQEFRVNIWDFGGQEIYHETHQFFLSKRSLYVLVADSREENTNFYWWLKVVELLSENSPVLIIKNEKQNRSCNINERELRGEFSNLKEVLATNLETKRGLAEIKDKIQKYISNLDHVGDKSPLPKLWVRVRSALENDSRNYISREEYYQLCRSNNLTKHKDMERLSGFLHDLGVCLHFQDDSTLKHYVILKPEWATTAVYKVLDNETVKRTNLGCFTQEELADIWKDSKYQGMQDELLQLMMRFKLCYQIPNRPGYYIAPQLLDYENLPDYDWDKSNNLILRYKYDFMPKGMVTRFIVETHPWIERQKIVWKSGVVLKKDETRAEVIESYIQREIKVRVSGNRKKDLIIVVNHELEKIHRSYERLKYETLVPCNCSECIGSENPYTYALENLRRRLEKGRYEIECDRSFEMVNVRRLIDDVNLSPQREEFGEFKVKNTPLQRELEIERELNSKVINQNQIEYEDFQFLVDDNNNIRVSSSQGDESGTLNLNINKMNLTLKLIELGQTNKDLFKALGSELYQALFPNQINARFHATIASAQEKKKSVRLRLIFNSPQLASLPWEFLYDEGTNTFLGNNTDTVLSRYIDVPLAKREIKSASLPLKVLLVISSPSNLNKLDATGEENLIREALKKQIETNKIELDVLTEATTSNIRQKLQEKSYNVFHFIGHGEFKDNQGHICLVDEYGKSNSLDDENFANFFLGNNHLGLVILNCCKGGTISSNQTFAGTVSNLVRRGIPAAVAMQYTILDSTAKLFTSEFYKTLALGFPVDRAIQSTRNAISQDVGLDKPDFAAPVLYMRAKDGIILNGL